MLKFSIFKEGDERIFHFKNLRHIDLKYFYFDKKVIFPFLFDQLHSIKIQLIDHNLFNDNFYSFCMKNASIKEIELQFFQNDRIELFIKVEIRTSFAAV